MELSQGRRGAASRCCRAHRPLLWRQVDLGRDALLAASVALVAAATTTGRTPLSLLLDWRRVAVVAPAAACGSRAALLATPAAARVVLAAAAAGSRAARSAWLGCEQPGLEEEESI
jgi:hypothetical protein